MWAARVVCWGFALGADRGFDLLAAHFNPRCEPPWSDGELRRKCDQAVTGDFRHPRGWLLDAEPDRPARHPAAPARIDPALTTPRPAAKPIPPFVPEPVGQGGEAVGSPVFVRNWATGSTENGGPAPRVPLTPQAVTAAVLRATGGWPKACGCQLFVPGPDYAPQWLDDPTALFAWLSTTVGRTGGLVEWGRGEGMVPKPEYYVHLLGAVEQYQDVQTYPHFPPRPGTYYLHPALPGGGSGAFDQLLDELKPATDTDRDLIRAFFLTLAWGGKLGGRPIFIFEASAHDGRPGQGAGKSTAAMMAGKLFGGSLNISLATADDLQVQTRLLSEQGRKARLVIFDNLKGTRVSNSLVESYVTADVISGRELYVGEGTRPNIVTWVITANQPSLSKDFVGRAYPVRIIPPRYSPKWTARTDRLVADHRWQIIGDILAELRAEPTATLADGEWSRWPEWEADVLCRVCDPRPLIEVVGGRREDLDDDDATTEAVREALVEYLDRSKIPSAECLHVTLPTPILVEALGKLCPHGPSPITVGRWLNSMTIPGLTKRRSGRARVWIWKGEEATDSHPDDWDRVS
jgi:hypothetical protein